MKNHLSVILGAGFSANALLPMASAIAERFNRDLKLKFISSYSSEWSWIDGKSEIDIRNGTGNFDYIPYSYVFDKLVKLYINENGQFIYYEDFYQYIIDKFKNLEWVENLFNVARDSLLIDYPHYKEDEYYKNYLFVFEHKQFSKVSAILNYLIEDLLRIIPKSNLELNEIYKDFIKYIISFEEVDIFTLNHDLLLEQLLINNGLNFSKGFNTKESPIVHNGNSVPFFDNDFKENIRIHKLHGSIDFYKFEHFKRVGTIFRPTGDYDYYMTTDFSTIHRSVRINPETGDVLQDHNFDIVPKFITGTRKSETIKNDKLYKSLYSNFESIMSKSTNLFISGYSFSDAHVNEKLKMKEFNFINHNRSKDYPFGGKGVNIRKLNDL
jgi:hypothetical protein